MFMWILAGVSLQCGERKFKAERLQRFLPATQRRRGAIDQRPFHVENHKRMTNRHGNGFGRRSVRHPADAGRIPASRPR